MDPRRRSVRRGAPLAVALVVVGGPILASCAAQGGDETLRGAGAPAVVEAGDEPGAEAAVSSVRFARAAQATAEAPTRRFSIVTEATGLDGEPLTSTVEGAVDLEARRSRTTSTIDPAGALSTPDGVVAESVVDGGVVYTRLPGLGRRAGDGRWIRVDAGAIGEALGFEAPMGSGALGSEGDPSGADRLLDLLDEAGGQVDEVGPEEVRGVDTTRYAAEVTVEGVLAAWPELDGFGTGRFEVAPVPVDVWIDGDDVVRRVVVVLSAADGDDRIEVRQTLELWDVGEALEIDVPSGDDVVDPAELFEGFGFGD